MKRLIALTAAFSLLAVTGVVPQPAAAHSAAIQAFPIPADVLEALPEGEGRETVAVFCSQCHSIGMVTSQRHSRVDWQDVLGRMEEQGFYASEEETDQILNYLTDQFGR